MCFTKDTVMHFYVFKDLVLVHVSFVSGVDCNVGRLFMCMSPFMASLFTAFGASFPFLVGLF